MLHITNGESVSLNKTGLPGQIVFWHDVLHEGPVPQGLALDELSRVREQFLSGLFSRTPAEVSLAGRDASLKGFQQHEEVILWFEHNLFDQLQLIQILDWFSSRALGKTKVSLICIDQDLGSLEASALAVLFHSRQAVTPAEMETARTAWEAFRSPDPERLPVFADTCGTTLPYLHEALLRVLDEFPSPADGLSRTERQAMHLVATGMHDFTSIFKACQELEEAIYLGELTFRHYLRRLARAPHPLLAEQGQRYEITGMGRLVLDGQENHVHSNGIDRWLGGVHLYKRAQDESAQS